MPPDPGRAVAARLAEALALDGAARWDEAHAVVARTDGPLAAWFHAYLHRTEGDDGNARYWYVRAGVAPRTGALADERAELVTAIRVLSEGPSLNNAAKPAT